MAESPILEEYWTYWSRWSGVWAKLSREERREILDLPILGHPGQGFRSDFVPTAIERNAVIGKILKAQGCKPDDAGFHLFARLAQVCREVGRFAGPDGDAEKLADALSRYVLGDGAKRELMVGGEFSFYSMHSDLPSKLETSRFLSRIRLKAFLAIPADRNGKDWEKSQRRRRGYPEFSQFTGLQVTATAQAILRRIVESGEPIPLEEAQRLSDQQGKGTIFEKALRALTQWVLAVVTLDPETGGFRIGLWPSLARRLAAGSEPDKPLATVAGMPSERWEGPFLVDEMFLLVTAATVEPLKLNKQKVTTLSAAKAKEIGSRLPPVPFWVRDSLYQRPQTIQVSTGAAISLDYLDPPKYQGSSSMLAASKAGRTWIAESATHRLKAVLDKLRRRRWGSPHHTNSDWNSYKIDGTYRNPADVSEVVSIEAGLIKAWKKLPGDAWVPEDRFLDHAAEYWSPLETVAGEGGTLAVARPKRYSPGFDFVVTEADTLRDEGRKELVRYLETRLVPLGAVRYGRAADGTVLIQLSEIGRYFLGLADELCVEEDQPAGRVVVQPNFEVTFLGPNFAAEAVFSAIAERAAKAPVGGAGALFRLTRASIQRAAHAGRDLPSILNAIETSASHPLPANVRAEIEAWVEGRKYYKITPATLIRCPSREIALRVHGALPGITTILNDTVLELSGSLTAAQRKRLEKDGLFEDAVYADRSSDTDEYLKKLDAMIRKLGVKPLRGGRRRRS